MAYTNAQLEAIAAANAELSNAGLPTVTELVHALEAVVKGATRDKGEDSTGQDYCHLRSASRDLAVETFLRSIGGL